MVNSINRLGMMAGALVFLAATLLIPTIAASRPDSQPARALAPTGSSLGPIMLVALAVLLIGGVTFLLLGRRRPKRAAADETDDTTPGS